ncbi:MFS transporter [Parasphingorhabdus sp.]|uniref:MFS transporter n=1 Tax=Parasphingorhabdus sp. TaxID=2709688 RepID=UPI003A91AE74
MASLAQKETVVTRLRARRNAIVVLLLGLLYVVSYLDRLILTLLVDPVRAEFSVSDTAIGLLLGPAFAIFVGIFSIPMGWLADRFNRTRLVLAAVTIWSSATLLTGFAPNFETVAGLRIGVAIAEAALFPVAISIIADLFPPARRAAATSTFIAFGVFGAFGAFFLGGVVVQWLGDSPVSFLGYVMDPWRATFVIVAVPGLVIAALLAMVVREVPRHAVQGKQAPGSKDVFLRRWGPLFFWLFLASSFGQAIGLGVSSWLPSLMVRDFGMDPGNAGMLFGVAGVTAALFGLLFAPRFAGYLQKRGRSGDLPLLAAGSVAIGSLILLAAFSAQSVYLLVPLVALAFFFIVPSGTYAVFAINWTVPRHNTGLFAAGYTLINSLIAIGLGPLVIAMVSDAIGGSSHLAEGMVVLTIGAGLGSVVLFILTHKFFAQLCRTISDESLLSKDLL